MSLDSRLRGNDGVFLAFNLDSRLGGKDGGGLGGNDGGFSCTVE